MEQSTNPLERTPEWIRPDLEKEKGEIERAVRSFLNKDINEQNIAQVIEILNNSPITELSDAAWEQLENTDSFHNITPGELETARRICEEYNTELEERNKRNFDTLLNGFHPGSTMECPTILKNAEGKMHLISGNTRLMIARALGIQPKVIIAEVR
jgi:hypothetical protein